MSNDEPSRSSPDRPARWSSPDVRLLGAVGAFGLVAFAAVYWVLLDRPAGGSQMVEPKIPSADVARPVAAGPRGPKGEPGPRGERGPAGPPGRPGDAGIRIVRRDCGGGNCTVECEDSEILLTAHCGAGRTPAAYPTEHSALCRSRGNAKVEVVAACVKLSPQ